MVILWVRQHVQFGILVLLMIPHAGWSMAEPHQETSNVDKYQYKCRGCGCGSLARHIPWLGNLADSVYGCWVITVSFFLSLSPPPHPIPDIVIFARINCSLVAVCPWFSLFVIHSSILIVQASHESCSPVLGVKLFVYFIPVMWCRQGAGYQHFPLLYSAACFISAGFLTFKCLCVSLWELIWSGLVSLKHFSVVLSSSWKPGVLEMWLWW